MRRKKQFNWSLLDRESLYSMLYQLKPEVVDKRLAIDQISSLFSKHIKAHLPVSVISSRFNPVRKGEIWLGGAYYSEKDRLDHKRFIEVELCFPPDAKTMKMSSYRFERVCLIFADIMLHEIIHTRQHRSRNFKSIPGYQSTAYYANVRKEQEYYGDRDEMGAHSFNLAQFMLDKFGTDVKSIKNYMDSPVPKRVRPNDWGRFMKAFEYDHNHPKVRQMKQKILKQLEYACIGKPFKTSNYLTY